MGPRFSSDLFSPLAPPHFLSLPRRAPPSHSLTPLRHPLGNPPCSLLYSYTICFKEDPTQTTERSSFPGPAERNRGVGLSPQAFQQSFLYPQSAQIDWGASVGGLCWRCLAILPPSNCILTVLGFLLLDKQQEYRRPEEERVNFSLHV